MGMAHQRLCHTCRLARELGLSSPASQVLSGMVTQALTFISETHGVGGAALPQSRDESMDEAQTEHTVSQVYYWK